MDVRLLPLDPIFTALSFYSRLQFVAHSGHHVQSIANGNKLFLSRLTPPPCQFELPNESQYIKYTTALRFPDIDSMFHYHPIQLNQRVSGVYMQELTLFPAGRYLWSRCGPG